MARVAEDLLEVERQQEHERGESAERKEPGGVAPADIRALQQPRCDEGLGDAGLDLQEHGEQDQRAQDRPPGAGMRPAVVAGGVDPEHERHQRERDGDGSGHVELGARPAGGLAQHERGDEDHRDGDDDVDEERPPPRHGPGEEPAEHRSGGEPGGHERSVEAERAGSGRAFGDIVVMSDSAAGVTIAVAMPCPTRAARSSTGSVASPPAREETPSSTIRDHEEALAAEQVGHAAEEEGEPCGAEREGGDDPLQRGGREAEFGANVRQGDVEDREVDCEGEVRRQQDRHRDLLRRGEPFRRNRCRCGTGWW